MTYTVMLTSVSQEMSADTVARLKFNSRHKIKVVAVDRRSDAEAGCFADVFECVEAWDNEGYARAVADLVDKHKVDMVLPLIDADVSALAGFKDLFTQKNCVLVCNDLPLIEVLSDKLRSYELFTHLGLPVADWRSADSREHLVTAVEQMFGLYGEVVVKPASAQSSRGVSVIRNSIQGAQEYLGSREVHMDYDTFMTRFVDVYDSLFPVLVMKRLKEPVYDVDVLAWQGDLKRNVVRRRRNSALPNEGHQILKNDMLNDLARDVAEKLNVSWLVDCDVMFDDTGAVCLLEINPRPSLSVVASISAGAPLFDDLISLAKGEPLPETPEIDECVVIPYRTMAVAKR